MNIFKTDPCPIISAQSLPNKLVIKMPTETAQLVACGFSKEILSAADCPKNKDGSNRRHFNPKHPSAIYTTKTLDNFIWVVNHGLALCREYTTRYKKRHFQEDFLNWALNNTSKVRFPEYGLQPLLLAMPDKYKTYPQDFMCYRAYINHEKTYCKWPAIDKIPTWFHTRSDHYVDKSFKQGVYAKK